MRKKKREANTSSTSTQVSRWRRRYFSEKLKRVATVKRTEKRMMRRNEVGERRPRLRVVVAKTRRLPVEKKVVEVVEERA